MKTAEISLAFGRVAQKAGVAIRFMQKKVAPVARFHNGIDRSCVTRDDDGAVRGFKLITESLVSRSMRHQEGASGHIPVLVDDPGLDFVHLHLVTCAACLL